MSALPDEFPKVAADTAAAAGGPEEADEAEVRNLYAIPRPEPTPEEPEEGEGVFARVLADFTPPAFWSEATPSPAEEFNRAQYGTHLQTTGVLRTGAIAYAAVAGAFNVKDKAKIWVRSHPSRLVVAGVLIGLLLVSPARPIVAWILFGLPHLAFEALMD